MEEGESLNPEGKTPSDDPLCSSRAESAGLLRCRPLGGSLELLDELVLSAGCGSRCSPGCCSLAASPFPSCSLTPNCSRKAD